MDRFESLLKVTSNSIALFEEEATNILKSKELGIIEEEDETPN